MCMQKESRILPVIDHNAQNRKFYLTSNSYGLPKKKKKLVIHMATSSGVAPSKSLRYCPKKLKYKVIIQ